MGDFYGDLANALVYPTELDHHGSASEGAGSSVIEANLCATLYGHSPWWGSVKSGFCVPTSDTGLTRNIVIGEAILFGHRICGTGNVACDFTANATNYVFLVLEYDTSVRVIRPIITINTTGTAPPTSILLGTVTYNNSPPYTITAYTDTRWMGKVSWGMVNDSGGYVNRGSYDWTSSGTFTITTAYSTYPCAMMLVTGLEGGNYIPQVRRTAATTFTVDFVDHAGTPQVSAFNFLILT